MAYQAVASAAQYAALRAAEYAAHWAIKKAIRLAAVAVPGYTLTWEELEAAIPVESQEATTAA